MFENMEMPAVKEKAPTRITKEIFENQEIPAVKERASTLYQRPN